MGEVGTAVSLDYTTMYVFGTVFDIFSPFDGLTPTNSEGSSAYVSRIHANGDRLTWFAHSPESSEWSQGYFIQADLTGVYVMYHAGPTPYSGATTDTYIRKFDSKANLLWEYQFANNDPLSFGLKDGVITVDAEPSLACAIDASDGSVIWTYAGGYGFSEGGAIRGPDVGGPTLWATDFFSGANHLALIGASGLIGEWTLPANVDTQTLMPTSDPRVFYGWDTFGETMLWRIEADGVSSPTVTQMGLTFGTDDSVGASMDPVTQHIFTHRPFSYSPANPFEVRSYDVDGTVLWGPNEIAFAEDFNGIFGNSRAHDSAYMQVAYHHDLSSDEYGVTVVLYGQSGSVLFSQTFGDQESGGTLGGAFSGMTEWSVGKGVGG